MKALKGAKLSDSIYREIYESSNNSVILLKNTSKLELISSNLATIRTFNFENEKDLFFISFYNLLPRLQFDGKLSVNVMKEAISNLKKRKSYIFELTCKKRDGALFLARVFIVALNEGDTICAYIRDITNEKEADEKLKLFSILTEQNPSLIVLTDKKGDILYVNKKFSDVTGYSYKEVLGKNPRVLKSESDPEKYKDLWNTLISGKIWRGEFYNRKKNGSHYWAFATIAPITNKKGNIIEFIGIQEDITERKNMEKKLNEKISEMEDFQKNTIDRELKMIELKKEINFLLKRQGLSKKYNV